MANSNYETDYFKIGAFVLVGIGLIVFALLVFSSDKMFQKIVHVETYFEESIQGISEGTHVKYRGLQIGYVEKLAFASEIYKKFDPNVNKPYSRSIYVQIAITSDLFTHLTKEKLNEFLTEEVAHGLRVKLVPQGLTGTNTLELDYAKNQKPHVPISWKPRYFYIPSMISTLTRLSDNAQYIMNELREINFKKIFTDLDTLTVTLNKTANRAESLIDKVDVPAMEAIQNIKVISEDLKMVSRRMKLKPSDVIFSSYPPPLDPNKL